MSYMSHNFASLFGGVAGDAGLGETDVDYIRNTPIPIDIGGIKANTYTPSSTVQALLDAICYPYQNPVVALSSSVPTTTRQKGVDSINGITLTATLTKKTSPLFKVEFYMGTTLLDTQECVEGTTVYTYEYTGVISDTTTFSAKGYDRNSKSNTASITYSFFYPNFNAVTTNAIADITMDEIVTNGTMRLEAKPTSKTLTYSGTMARYIFCFPTEWGNISSILDKSGYEYINAFQKVSLTYTSGTDNIQYYMYISKEPCNLSVFAYTFKF